METDLQEIKIFTKNFFSYGDVDYSNRTSELIDKCKKLEQIVNVISKKDVLQYLDNLHKLKLATEQDVANVLLSQWTRLERFHNVGMSKSKLIKFMNMADKSCGYGAVSNKIPKVVTIYRGTSVETCKGLSWTRNREVAEWFAKRFIDEKECGYVFSGQLKREDIIASFSGRNESEIVCDWKNVKDIQCEKVIKTGQEVYKFRK